MADATSTLTFARPNAGSVGADSVEDQANTLGHYGGDIQDAAYQEYLGVLTNGTVDANGVPHSATPSEIAAATAKYGIETQRAVQILKSIGKSEDFMKSVVQALQ